MRALANVIPNADVVLALSPEELAQQLLSLVKQQIETEPHGSGLFHPGNSIDHLAQPDIGGVTAYPSHQLGDVVLAVKEAWAWSDREGLTLPADGVNGRNGFKMLSRRARDMELSSKPSQSDPSKLLPKEILRREIVERAWLPFVRGEFDTAILMAMKQVEISLRTLAGDDAAGKTATQVARMMFDPDRGRLTDKSAERSEREAAGHLYAGALGVLKNPHSHRNVDVDDAVDAAAILTFANYLLRDIEARAASYLLT